MAQLTGTQDYRTAEAKAFREHYDKLVDCIQEADLPVLGARFFSREIISRETMEMVGNVSTSRAVRASKLLLAVMAHLDTQPDKFETALDVFREEHLYSDCVCIIQESHGIIGAQLPASHSTFAPPTTATQRFVTHLQKVYLRSKLPNQRKWPPPPCKKILNLVTVEHEEVPHRFDAIEAFLLKHKTTPIAMENILATQDGSASKLVVVKGDPGIGKSTFAWKFCRKWAKGKICQRFDLVVLLRMRDKRVREAAKLSHLFFSEDDELSKDVTKEVLSREGEGVLLFLEGLDELPASCLVDGSLLSNILQGESLPEATIIVTSRPWAVQMLREKCDNISRQIVILGFTKEDILTYISYAFTAEEKTEFLVYLHSHPQLESLMRVPLNASFVVQIYKEFKTCGQAIPHTLTQLYTALIKGLLLRYMKQAPELSHCRLESLENLPKPLKSCFEYLCELAYKSFTKHPIEVTFTVSDSGSKKIFDSLGLMQSSASLSIVSGTIVTHSFLHFTIQEFLAAYHLSRQSTQEQISFLQSKQSGSVMFKESVQPEFIVLVKFLIGLNSEILSSYNLVRMDQHLIDQHHYTLKASNFHFLFESQSPQHLIERLGTNGVRYPGTSTPETAFDLYALSYCLCHSQCLWDLTINLEEVSSFYRSEVYQGRIEKLYIRNSSNLGVQTLFSLPCSIFSTLTNLTLNYFEACVDTAIARFIRGGLFPRLKELAMGFKSESGLDGFDLISALCSHSTLTSLCLAGVTFTLESMKLLCDYISSPHIKIALKLELVNNIYSEDSFKCLTSAITCSVKCLYLYNSSFSIEEMELLSAALSTNCTMKELKMQSCSLDGERTELIANGLETNRSILNLNLSCNNIGPTGAIALAAMLLVNNVLEDIDLYENETIGREGALKLITAVEHNTSLKHLYLPRSTRPQEFGSRSVVDLFFNPLCVTRRVFF